MAEGPTDSPGDDPAEAFERLRGEVSLLRHAVGALTTARETIEMPDYEPTLARTERVLTVLAQQIEGMRQSPALTLTPEQMSREIVSSALHARREDQRLIIEARAGIDQAVRAISNRLATARHGEDQKRWLYATGIGGLALGMLIWAVLAGPFARAMPASWQWPEHVAVRVLGESDSWSAGQRLMQVGSPQSWSRIVAADHRDKDNRDVLQACQKAAAKAKKPVRCTIEVKPGE